MKSKNYIVVGAAGNLGPVWCRTLLENDHHVIGIGKKVTTDTNLIKLRKNFLETFQCYELDLSDGIDLQEIPILEHNNLDGVVLNLGIDSPPTNLNRRIIEFSIKEWNEILNLNVSILVNCINRLIPKMNSESSIVVIGSMYTRVAPNPRNYAHVNNGLGFTKNPAYGASKLALESVVKQYAIELAPNIRINMLSPGAVLGGQDPEFIRKISENIPMKRLLNAIELSGHLEYLISEQSKYLTGQNLVIDGGYSLW